MIDIVKALENTKLNMQSEKNSYKDVNKSNKEKFSKILFNKNNNDDGNKDVKSNTSDGKEVCAKDQDDELDSNKNVKETDSKKVNYDEDKSVSEKDSKKEVSNEDENKAIVSTDELLELQNIIVELIKQLKATETTEQK